MATVYYNANWLDVMAHAKLWPNKLEKFISLMSRILMKQISKTPNNIKSNKDTCLIFATKEDYAESIVNVLLEKGVAIESKNK